jgi:transposase
VYYGAIDLHSNNSVLGIIDETGKRIFSRKLPNNLEAIKNALASFDDLQQVVIESTFNWYWLVDGLKDADYKVQLANTAAIEQYGGLKHSDDKTDAFFLADLSRLNILKEGYVYPRMERAVRDLLRKRAHLVRQRTQNILSAENLVARNTGVQISCRELGKLTPEQVQLDYTHEEDRALAISCTLRVIDALNEEIAILEKQVKGRLKSSKQYELLQTLPGVGEILGMSIALETGEIGRFQSVGNYSSYCRCVKSERMSNQKKKGSGNRRNGNKYLAWAFTEAANFAIRYNPEIRKFYDRKKAKTKIVVARMAVAHKLARAAYYIMRDEVAFDITKSFCS